MTSPSSVIQTPRSRPAAPLASKYRMARTPRNTWCIGSKVDNQAKDVGVASMGTVPPAEGSPSTMKRIRLTSMPAAPKAASIDSAVTPTARMANVE